MRLCLDTRYLIEVSHENDYALELFSKLLRGEYLTFLPLICISEFVKISYYFSQDLKDKIDKLLFDLKRAPMIIPVGLSFKLAKYSGELQYKYNLSLGDSIVAATGIHNQCKYIITDDTDFEKAVQKLIKWRFRL